MRIAQIVCTFPPYMGGIGSVAHNYSRLLTEQGHDVSVFTPDYNKRLKNTNNDLFKIIKIKPLLKYGNGAFIPALFFKLKEFDIVHLHMPFFGGSEVVWLAKLAYNKNFKLIAHYHMDIIGLPILTSVLSMPSKLINRLLYARADAVTCASLDYIENSQIKNIYALNKDKFYEIPFGVDTKIFKPGRTTNGTGSSSKRTILFVGGLDRAHHFKGVDILLRAVLKLPIDDCRLTIVGDGELRTEYEILAKKIGIGGRVNFIGSVDTEKLVSCYQNADVFVLPSINKHEAFGLVLLEAMACGVPIIASNLPGVRSVFEDGKQGILVKPGNAVDLSEKLNYLLFNDIKREAMGVAGIDLVKIKYGWAGVIKRLIGMYKKLLKQ